MTKYIVDIKGEIEGDYEIIGKYEEPEVKGDLISREALKKAIKNSFKHNLNGYDALLISEIDEFIDNAPTVEPEKIAVANVTFDKEQLEEIVEKAKTEVLAVVLDANERPQGEWIKNRVAFYQGCPECGAYVRSETSEVYLDPRELNFCPNCGTKMKLDSL